MTHLGRTIMNTPRSGQPEVIATRELTNFGWWWRKATMPFEKSKMARKKRWSSFKAIINKELYSPYLTRLIAGPFLLGEFLPWRKEVLRGLIRYYFHDAIFRMWVYKGMLSPIRKSQAGSFPASKISIWFALCRDTIKCTGNSHQLRRFKRRGTISQSGYSVFHTGHKPASLVGFLL